MISILIPIYNRDARILVRNIIRQAEQLEVLFEIICVDNCSIFFREKNIQIKDFPNCQYELLDSIVNQSHVRNKLSEMAKYDHLLFIDCDLKINYHHFVRNYVNLLPAADFASGGIHYLPWPPTPEYFLHWQFGVKREVKSTSRGNHFLTCNFLIRKTIFEKIKFVEPTYEYGHDNIMFEVELDRLKIKRTKVFSPVSHAELYNSEDLLDTTKSSIDYISSYVNRNELTLAEAKSYWFVKTYLILKRLKCSKFTAAIFPYFVKSIEQNLRGAHPILFLLDIYKLGLLCQQSHLK